MKKAIFDLIALHYLLFRVITKQIFNLHNTNFNLNFIKTQTYLAVSGHSMDDQQTQTLNLKTK